MSLLRVRMSLTRRDMLAKVPGRTSSIRLLVRFTESSLGCVTNESGYNFSATEITGVSITLWDYGSCEN